MEFCKSLSIRTDRAVQWTELCQHYSYLYFSFEKWWNFQRKVSVSRCEKGDHWVGRLKKLKSIGIFLKAFREVLDHWKLQKKGQKKSIFFNPPENPSFFFHFVHYLVQHIREDQISRTDMKTSYGALASYWALIWVCWDVALLAWLLDASLCTDSPNLKVTQILKISLLRNCLFSNATLPFQLKHFK